MRMVKKALNLLIEADLVDRARQQGIVIRRFLENKLQEYFSFINVVSKPSIQHHKSRTDLSGFEPESEAPEASVISKLHYRPRTTRLIRRRINRFCSHEELENTGNIGRVRGSQCNQ